MGSQVELQVIPLTSSEAALLEVPFGLGLELRTSFEVISLFSLVRIMMEDQKEVDPFRPDLSKVRYHHQPYAIFLGRSF